MSGRKRDTSLLSMIQTRKWPWPGDSKLGQVQRIARAYRELAERAAPLACAAMDRRWHEYGHFWVAPTAAEYPETDDYIPVADAAHYVSQWYPCDARLIYKWVQRDHIESHVDENGNLSVRWGSIVAWNHRQTTRREA